MHPRNTTRQAREEETLSAAATCESFAVLNECGRTKAAIHCATMLLSELGQRLQLLPREARAGSSNSHLGESERQDKYTQRHERGRKKKDLRKVAGKPDSRKRRAKHEDETDCSETTTPHIHKVTPKNTCAWA